MALHGSRAKGEARIRFNEGPLDTRRARVTHGFGGNFLCLGKFLGLGEGGEDGEGKRERREEEEMWNREEREKRRKGRVRGEGRNGEEVGSVE